ncbi:hypothetical protein PIB30_116919 [Stylosanthes scabra]|uniref:Uncharacterized protein n=1 Tax=Stylosanthes scabra TaxID=79078 RepID=A0ABU6ZBK3_9FABA|nr:hypothetical protein [Stylosanthes scabra]
MAKHGVSHALTIILIIAAIIHFTIADFHETALTKQKSTKKPYSINYGFPKYPDAFVLDTCFEKCSKKFQNKDENIMARCNEKCKQLHECIDKCNEIYANDAEGRNNCYKGCKFGGGHHIEIRNPWHKRKIKKTTYKKQ